MYIASLSLRSVLLGANATSFLRIPRIPRRPSSSTGLRHILPATSLSDHPWPVLIRRSADYCITYFRIDRAILSNLVQTKAVVPPLQLSSLRHPLVSFPLPLSWSSITPFTNPEFSRNPRKTSNTPKPARVFAFACHNGAVRAPESRPAQDGAPVSLV